MHFFPSNLKKLRSLRKLSQAHIAKKIQVSRTNIAKYEGGVHEPSITIIIQLAREFGVTIDILLTKDLRSLSDLEIEKLKSTPFQLMPIQVDSKGCDLIEVVPHNAQAGYTGMYSDPDFIESLDSLQLPVLNTQGKCRAFPISGDSMPPYGMGSYIIGEFISDRSMIREGERYVILSKSEGIVFKRLYINNPESIQLYSDNPKYDPFTMNWSEVLEVWRFVAGLNLKESETQSHLLELKAKIDLFKEELDSLSNNFSFK